MLALRSNEIEAPIPGVDYASLMLEPGDGRVPRSSLLGRLPTESTFALGNLLYICEAHTDMTSSFEVRHNVVNLLLPPD